MIKHLSCAAILGLACLSPAFSHAERWVSAEDKAQAECEASLKLSPEQLQSGLHRNEVAICVRGKIFDADVVDKRDRISRKTSQFSGALRVRVRDQAEERLIAEERAKASLRAQMLDRATIKKRQATQQAGARSRVRTVEDFSTRDSKRAQSLRFRDLQQRARDACKTEPRGLKDNCVREALRDLGSKLP